MQGSARQDPGLRDVAMLAIAVAGLAACITLLFLSMRAVLDIGGMCAEGGPYVIEQHCPEGSIPTMFLGMFGLFGFGGLGMYAGSRVGSWGALLPLLGWTALFASLGWNFLDYGVLNPPTDVGIEWGWAIPGVLFELMAWAPLAIPVAIGIGSVRGARRPGTGTATRTTALEPGVLRGPGQPPRAAAAGVVAARVREPAPETEARQTLREIASAMGSVVDEVAAETPVDPDRRIGVAVGDAIRPPVAAPAPDDFSEGTQALLDRLERLADMRDRGLLEPAEYETAKDAIMRELESRG